MTTTTTYLGGTLIRLAKDQYQWKDGTPEPRCSDLTISAHYNFRCRTYGDPATYVEVPLSAAYKEPDVLGWVIEGVKKGKYRQNTSGDHTGPRVCKEDGSTSRMRIEPGEDPLHGNEPIIRKRSIPRVALVPIEEWDERSAQTPYGVMWDEHDAILEKARSLGWQQAAQP